MNWLRESSFPFFLVCDELHDTIQPENMNGESRTGSPE